MADTVADVLPAPLPEWVVTPRARRCLDPRGHPGTARRFAPPTSSTVAGHPGGPDESNLPGGEISMTLIRSAPPRATRPYPPPRAPRGAVLRNILHTTDPKTIGLLYVFTTFAFFLAGGLLAMLMRAELAHPGLQFLSPEQYSQLFTMHGTIMLLFYATPVVFGFANLVLPFQIGAPDVAFPRLNALSYWLYLFGALIAVAGFATPGGAAAFGWTAYTPLSDVENFPAVGGDLWAIGLIVSGVGTIVGAVNLVTTLICLRCPGMTMWRLPIFCWTSWPP
jgi:cytochrome c oxidase subunit 1